MIKHRPAPKPPEFSTGEAALLRNPDIRFWAERIAADPDAKPVGLAREELAYAYRLAAGRPRTSKAYDHAYERALRALTPSMSAPRIDDAYLALCQRYELPEMQQFWAEWQPERSRYARGPKPNVATAKACFSLLGMTGTSAFVDDAYAALAGGGRLLEMFETLERLASGKAAPSLPGFGSPPAQLRLAGKSSVYRQLEALAEPCITLARATRINLLRSLRDDYFPRIGRHAMIDGSDIPAWARQRGAASGDVLREAELRAHAPEAGFRIYERTNKGKMPVDGTVSKGALKARVVKAWRGYYKVTICDSDSGGLPLVTNVFDASRDEAPALIGLLQDLYALWPDVGVIDIAGDSAWDEDWACQTCLQNYGIHPIFRFHNDRGRKIISPEHSRDGSVKALTGRGQLVCAAHGNVLAHRGLEGNVRTGLAPGEPNPRTLRVRGECRDGCGRLGLKCDADWSKLLHHPHFGSDGPGLDLFAYRQARLHALNDIESYHNRLKAGHKLGTEGPDRTRLRDLSIVTALMELADLAMVAAQVWDVRNESGVRLDLVTGGKSRAGAMRAVSGARDAA